MKYIKFLLVPMLFVSLAFMNIGGCGNSGGGNNPPPTNPPPTQPPPTNPPPTNPPPTQPPPTQPPGVCQIPALDTDFSDELYIFIDDIQGIGMGVTSDGQETITVLIDTFGTVVSAIADVISPFACLIDTAFIDGLFFSASGLCGRSDDATLFLVADFFVGSVEIIDLTIGECVAVEPITTSNIETTMQRVFNNMALNEEQEQFEPSIDFGNALDDLEQKGLLE
jgi:hypothetical protein